MFGKFVLVLTVVCAFTVVAIEGRRVLLRPISVVEVQRLLRKANREDAVPEGRVISHGLAALKGFALGLKKGVLGVAIVDGLAALSLSNSTSNSSTTYNKPSVSYNGTTNEICFTSRSATSDIIASGDAEERAGTKVTPTTTGTTTGSGVVVGTGTATGTGSATNTGTTTNTATTTSDNAGTVSCIALNKT